MIMDLLETGFSKTQFFLAQKDAKAILKIIGLEGYILMNQVFFENGCLETLLSHDNYFFYIHYNFVPTRNRFNVIISKQIKIES